jgi:ParB family chromosome partitioning protein
MPERKTTSALLESADHSRPAVVPSGQLVKLRPDEVIPSQNNPRHLFDREPLDTLKKSIRQHGVLVPITVYKPKGQRKFSILDGQRRYICCVELQQSEGIELKIPANVVEPPDKIASLLYMFSIHNFREQWELMPTALALRTIKEALGEDDNKVLAKLTGLSEPQLERCKKLLTFPERFQELSLDPNPKRRIPSNFWIEAYPVLNLCDEKLPDLVEELGRDGITDRLVEKYRAKRIKSVLHFRRIMEAYEIALDDEAQGRVLQRLREYIADPQIETRAAFDDFVVEARRVQGAVSACEDFIRQLQRLKLEYLLDRNDVRTSLEQVRDYAQQLIYKLEGGDPPAEPDEEENDTH